MVEIRREQFKRQFHLSDLQAEDKVNTAVRIIAATGLCGVFSTVNRAELESVLRAQLIEKGIKPGFSLKSPDYMCFLGYAYTLLDEVCARYPDAEQVDFVVSRNGKITDHIKTFHEELRAHVKEFDPRLAKLVGRLLPDDMENSGPLQAADVFCWHMQRFEEGRVQNANLSRLCWGNCGPVRRQRWGQEGLDRQAKAIISHFQQADLCA
jgi:hypothetical protein